jgi:hypothetical protein
MVGTYVVHHDFSAFVTVFSSIILLRFKLGANRPQSLPAAIVMVQVDLFYPH